MSGIDNHQNERQAILTRLLDAVKQCQVRFGGRSELATDSDSRVSCLCAAWETVLQHGMKNSSKALSALKQMTERTGLGKVTDIFSDIKRVEAERVFWQYAKEHLTKHEYQRFNKLKFVNTDSGRGRAWLRASLNEHSLERYMHMLIESDEMLSQHYENWAFLRDLERSSMLPNMAAGLGSILFAITVDRPELNKGYSAPNSIHVQSSMDYVNNMQMQEEPEPVISENTSPGSSKKKDKKKKKKMANVVSFEEDDTKGTVITRTSSTSSNSVFADSGEPHLNGETRENGEGTQDDCVFSSDALEDIAFNGKKDGHKEPLMPALSRISGQMGSPSIRSGNSDRQSSLGSSSDDHDSTAFMAPVGSDGQVIDTEMVPLNEVSAALYRSHSSSCASDSPKREMENASLALVLAQQGLSNSNNVIKDGRSQGDKTTLSAGSMSHEELKQAVVAMMLRKDSIQEQNRKLEGMLQHEMETSSTLRAEIEEMKIQYASVHEKEQAKLQALQKENELLKHQLKKYVSAVQMLRTEGISREDTLGIHLEDPQPCIPANKPMIDYSHEAAEYEKKLIQVAEMHGELMEFNELLHRQIGAKDLLLRQLREELIVLRGPCSALLYKTVAEQLSKESKSLPSSTLSCHMRDMSQMIQDKTLIACVYSALSLTFGFLQHFLEELPTILTMFIKARGRPRVRWIDNITETLRQHRMTTSAKHGQKTKSPHDTDQLLVYVRIRDEEWNVYRRYSQFLDTHMRLKKVYPIVGKFDFPPKKAIGKKEARVVESRRQMFQAYLRNVINLMMEKSQHMATNASKEKLITYLPFFNDKLEDASKRAQAQKGGRSPPVTIPVSVPEGATGGERTEELRENQYQGL